MAAQLPLSRLVLSATSIAEDLSFVALHEISKIQVDGRLLDFRLIGGHMVALHVQRWQLGRELYRETLDADVGVLPLTVTNTDLLDQIRSLGYEQIEGNRFSKTIQDIPGDALGRREAIIDILIPAFRSRARANIQVGEELVTTEVLGLAQAFQKEPSIAEIQITRLNGEVLKMKVPLPDEAAALVPTRQSPRGPFAGPVRGTTRKPLISNSSGSSELTKLFSTETGYGRVSLKGHGRRICAAVYPSAGAGPVGERIRYKLNSTF